MRVVIYARVSKPPRNRKYSQSLQEIELRQREQDVTNQLLKLREFADGKGWKLIREYVDRKSGKTSDRDQFQAMFAAARRKEFDIVLFWSLDRFSREGTVATLNHLSDLANSGVEFMSLQEQYVNSLGPWKHAIIGFLAAIAQQERLRISERTKAGLDRLRDAAKARGETLVLGRPSISTSLSVQVLDLKNQGITKLDDIASRVTYTTKGGDVRNPSTATIRRALARVA